MSGSDRDAERLERSRQGPIVGSLPDAPGIGAAMRLTPGLATHLRGLADELLVNDFPGATIDRAQRELIATAVSAQNDCFYCMDSHAAHASALFQRAGRGPMRPVLDGIKVGSSDGLDPKMRELISIARTVARGSSDLTAEQVAAARAGGASDGDVQLAVLIAAAFSMYNRMVDGLRATTPANTDAYTARAAEIAERGYAATSVPPRRPDLR